MGKKDAIYGKSSFLTYSPGFTLRRGKRGTFHINNLCILLNAMKNICYTLLCNYWSFILILCAMERTCFAYLCRKGTLGKLIGGKLTCRGVLQRERKFLSLFLTSMVEGFSAEMGRTCDGGILKMEAPGESSPDERVWREVQKKKQRKLNWRARNYGASFSRGERHPEGIVAGENTREKSKN